MSVAYTSLESDQKEEVSLFNSDKYRWVYEYIHRNTNSILELEPVEAHLINTLHTLKASTNGVAAWIVDRAEAK